MDRMCSCCCQLYVAFSFEDLHLNGISEIIMETFTLGTAIGLNMTHNAAAWNRARLVEAKLSCFCWCINALMKSTRLERFQRDHG